MLSVSFRNQVTNLFHWWVKASVFTYVLCYRPAVRLEEQADWLTDYSAWNHTILMTGWASWESHWHSTTSSVGEEVRWTFPWALWCVDQLVEHSINVAMVRGSFRTGCAHTNNVCTRIIKMICKKGSIEQQIFILRMCFCNVAGAPALSMKGLLLQLCFYWCTDILNISDYIYQQDYIPNTSN